MVCQLILNQQNQIAKYVYKRSNQSNHSMEFQIEKQNRVNLHILISGANMILLPSMDINIISYSSMMQRDIEER